MYHIEKQLFRTPFTKPDKDRKGAHIGFMLYSGEGENAGLEEISKDHQDVLSKHGWREKTLANGKTLWFTFMQNEVNKVVRVLKPQIEGGDLSKRPPCGFVWFLEESDVKGLDMSIVETYHYQKK
jgi:hypothetical protein